jgi:signal transduction histidine kinase
MRPLAKVYIGAVLLMGLLHILSANWSVTNPWAFLALLLASLLASGLKVGLPGIFGTLSVSYFFILIAIADMSRGEAIVIGCASALVQCVWHARQRVRLVQAAFSTMNVAITVVVAHAFYHSQVIHLVTAGSLLPLIAASLLYFGVNTAGVAIVIALTESKPFVGTWRECYFWSFPFYLMAASLVWIVRSVDVRTQWLNMIALFPVVYVIYYSYRIYIEKIEAGRKEIELANALQKRTIEALEVAREANAMKSRFIASISHELRTPLNGISGFAEMLHDGVLGPLNELQRECAADMLTCSNHLRMLIGQVLDLAKAEAGKMTFDYERVSPAGLIREVIDTLQAIANGHQIQVAVETNARIDSVVADAGKLKQILYNYLSNALKHTAAGGRVVVKLSSEDSETYRIDVEDTGAGIPPDEIPRLFSEFSQVGDIAKTKTGSGLGLAICKRLAEAQGGRVGVTSQIGRGSTFFVVMPRTPKPACTDPDSPAAADPSSREAAKASAA